jgi:hypothetical protein
MNFYMFSGMMNAFTATLLLLIIIFYNKKTEMIKRSLYICLAYADFRESIEELKSLGIKLAVPINSGDVRPRRNV